MDWRVVSSLKKPLLYSLFILYGMLLLSCAPEETVVPPSEEIETLAQFFARCPTREEIQRVNLDFKISFEFDPTAGTFVCESASGSEDLTALQKRAYQSLYVMRLLHFSRPLPWTEKQLYDWMADTIDGIRFVDGGYSYCCDPENTIVIALHADSAILQTDQWIDLEMGEGLMESTLMYVHEARHNEGFHHTCTTRNGDDNTLDEIGAWAVQHYLALWIAQYSAPNFLVATGNNPNAYRRAALEAAEVTRLTRFCKEVYTEPGPTLIP